MFVAENYLSKGFGENFRQNKTKTLNEKSWNSLFESYQEITQKLLEKPKKRVYFISKIKAKKRR
jgi:uncharacterized protein YqgV (UPF0045/DUF77 family)